MKILRIIDANFNRIKEGFRVIEDGLRFYYDEKELTERLKTIRHKFTEKIIENFGNDLPLWREPEKDIGKDIKTHETKNILHLIKQNFGRIQEGLRVIEEYSKIIKPDSINIWVEFRFQVYQLEKDILKKIDKL
jgi:thiamine-phosphate pyrophosphorylase